MLYSGISWSGTGFETSTYGEDGRPVGDPERYALDGTEALISRLLLLDSDDGVAVIDSTNGMLDGRMMAAGLTVYRADPHVLPARTGFGSVPAADIAAAAAARLSALTRLERRRGTQTGREPDLERWIASSAAATAALTSSGRCLSAGSGSRAEVALTFDDGPHPVHTAQVLDVLRRYDVPGTFFCIGLNAAAHPELVARMQAEGHCLGNHTWSHPFLPELGQRELDEQVARTGEVMAGTGGDAPSFFRPPYGSRTPDVLSRLAQMEPQTVLWDVEAEDWAMPGTTTIADRILQQTVPGSIILLHDGGGDRSQTVEALPIIIEGLLDRGYSFVGVDAIARDASHQPTAASS